jgi:type III pantothenate kinase
MLSLIVDIGNTRTKVALFNQGELMISFPANGFSSSDLDVLFHDYPGISRTIISSVKDREADFISKINENIPFVIELDHNTPLPFLNLYKTPETLGRDRIAAIAGAQRIFPNQNVLVIDAGTAITYDFISSLSEYHGGFISPGLQMRLKALNLFTKKLPLLEAGLPIDRDGLSTEEAILGGVQYGLEGEFERIINIFNNKHGNLTIILCGGDTNYFEKILKNHNFVTLEITLIGLNTILEYNYNQTTYRK